MDTSKATPTQSNQHQELLDLIRDIVDWDSTTWAMPKMEQVARKLLMDAARQMLQTGEES